MTISKTDDHEAFVWIWLPDQLEPVVAGKLSLKNEMIVYHYGKSYLQRENAMAIFPHELPLKPGFIYPIGGLGMASCIRDASPDAWGRRVILNKMFGHRSLKLDTTTLNELTYLLQSGSDRIGALDFQPSGTIYEPRGTVNLDLSELLDAANRVELGIPLTPELDSALYHGSSIGGARPKAMIEYGDKKYIAKFSASTDVYNLVKLEWIAMRLAKLVGLNVATVEMVHAAQKDILLIERFDRVRTPKGWLRKSMVSALTLLELDEMMARYASYEKLAEIIRYQFEHPSETLKELFSRLVFNILIGNTDDHARNHAAFWNGKTLSLTPAYDLCPQNRTGEIASQAMFISDQDRSSQLSSCLAAAHHFLISEQEATDIITHQVNTMTDQWTDICNAVDLSPIERNLFWHRQFLNPYAFEGLNL
ncbi:MAG: HipA domain-containing protein [Legionellales bacterium]|nr:HipA domain-containing protein [Legionellales bacterium]